MRARVISLPNNATADRTELTGRRGFLSLNGNKIRISLFVIVFDTINSALRPGRINYLSSSRFGFVCGKTWAAYFSYRCSFVPVSLAPPKSMKKLYLGWGWGKPGQKQLRSTTFRHNKLFHIPFLLIKVRVNGCCALPRAGSSKLIKN